MVVENMFVLGIVVLAFLVVHLIQFWSKMQLAEICHYDVVDCATGESVPPPPAHGFWQSPSVSPLHSSCI